MEDKNNQMKKSSSLNLSLPSPENGIYDEEKQSSSSDSPSKTSKRKPGGWRAMPYVLGNGHLLAFQKPLSIFSFYNDGTGYLDYLTRYLVFVINI